MIFPPCQPSLPGHCTVCKTCNCKTNIFFHCPSEPHGPSGRPALQAKPFYFSTPTASIQQSEVFHFHQRDCRERSREQSVLSSSGKVTEPPATHSLLMPTRGHSLLPESAGRIPHRTLACFIPTSATDQMNVCTYFFQNQVQCGIKGTSASLTIKWVHFTPLYLAPPPPRVTS